MITKKVQRSVVVNGCAVCGAALLVLASGCGGIASEREASADAQLRAPAGSIHQFSMDRIDGEPLSLASFRGKVLLVVNVASRCGLTKQYQGLQKLYETYQERGFVVLGFPANNFLGQEPGSNAEIQQFCERSFGVTFPMFAKISVKGEDQHPLYTFLTDKTIHPEFGGSISWNFNKFLIDGEGRVIGRFGSRVRPMAPDLVRAVEQALAAATSTSAE